MKKKQEARFIVDFMLGRLARWLRMLGFDTEYVTEKEKNDIILRSLKDKRILITRNHSLSAKRSWNLVLIKEDRFKEQIKQLLKELDIDIFKSALFSRCSICNEVLSTIKDKNEIKESVPEYVYETQNNFSFCPKCNRVYWHGTHLELLLKDLKSAGIELKEADANLETKAG